MEEWFLIQLAKIDNGQKEIADYYAALIKTGGHNIAWDIVNAATVNRWSKSGLIKVKRMAWKIVNEYERNYAVPVV